MMQVFHAGNTCTNGQGVVNSDITLPSGYTLRGLVLSLAAQIAPGTTGYHLGYAALVFGGLFDTGTLGKNNVIGQIFVSGYRIAAGDVGFQSSQNLSIPNLEIPLGPRPSLRLTTTAGLYAIVLAEVTIYTD